MEEQLVGIGDILYVEQLDGRVALGVEVFIHILQHILYAYLLSVADRPYGVELQPLHHSRLQDEDSRCSRTADKVHPLRVELRYGLGEDTVVAVVEQADAVRSYECRPMLLARVEYVLFESRALRRLLAKASGDDDEGLGSFLLGKGAHRVGAEGCGYDEYGKFGRRQFGNVVKDLYAMHLILLRVDDSQSARIPSIDDVADDGSAWFVHIVRATDNDDGLGLKKFSVNHNRNF